MVARSPRPCRPARAKRFLRPSQKYQACVSVLSGVMIGRVLLRVGGVTESSWPHRPRNSSRR